MRFLAALILPLAVVSLPSTVHAQSEIAGTSLTGSLRTDLVRMKPLLSDPGSLEPFIEGTVQEEKSPWLAGALSAALPGSGQIYAEAPWWRAALYGIAEVVGWTTFLVYESKGVTATTAFEQFADSHWDVVRYVEWIEANYQRWDAEQIDRQAIGEALATIYRSDDTSLDPWERIDFDALNRIERAVKGGFSHTLPRHGDQQYYEQIGKYVQYRAGWVDHPFDADTLLFAPEFTTRKNLEYVEMRNTANDYLGYASWGIGLLLTNHLVSMVDAALEARGYNARLHARFESRSRLDGSIDPAGRLELRIGF